MRDKMRAAVEQLTGMEAKTQTIAGRLNQPLFSLDEQQTPEPSKMLQVSRHFRRTMPLPLVLQLLLLSLSAIHLYLGCGGQVHASPLYHSSSLAAAATTNQSLSIKELTRHLEQLEQRPVEQMASFDTSSYRTVLDAIKAHHDLRKFAELCESTSVKHVMSLQVESLTVFAPVDSSLEELLVKAQERRINLDQLARNHVINDANEDLENSPHFPLKLTSKSRLPLYVNRGPNSALFVNNARKLATYFIQTGVEKVYHTLHVVDEPLVGAFLEVQRGGQVPLGIESVLEQSGGIYEFAERFADLKNGGSDQLQASLHKPRVFQDTNLHHHQQQQQQQVAKVTLTREQLDLRGLGSALGGLPELRATFYQTNESTTLNTYFVPLNSRQLSDTLGQLSPELLGSWAKAQVIPNQVLFTRTMDLGHAYLTASDSSKSSPAAKHSWLSLIKSLPVISRLPESSDELAEQLLSKPLIVQAGCSLGSGEASSGNPLWRAGLTNAELVLGNIPISNGVVHFIREPLFVPTSDLREYLDKEDQISYVATSLHSKSSTPSYLSTPGGPPTLHKFRRLLEQARNNDRIPTYLKNRSMTMTMLVPTDEAFGRLRYDVRALIDGDESLIPPDWSSDKRQSMLEELIKTHLIVHTSVTSEQISSSQGLEELSSISSHLRFESLHGVQPIVKFENVDAYLLQRDLLTSQGVVHIINRVLGQPEETIYSLLEKNQIKLKQAVASVIPDESSRDFSAGLDQLIASSARNQQQSTSSHQEAIYPIQGAGSRQQINYKNSVQAEEYRHTSQSIEQFLSELSANNRPYFEILSSSMNISFQLAQLQADGWNDKFKELQGQYTYFIPSDLAWLKALTAYPVLYRPLMSALGRSASSTPTTGSQELLEATNHIDQQQQQQTVDRPVGSPFIRILERHLVNNKKIHAHWLVKINSFTGSDQSQVQLVEPPHHPHEFVRSLKLKSSLANIQQFYETTNGYLYLIDNVLLTDEDADSVSQVKPVSSAFSLSMATQNFLTEYLRYNANSAIVLLIGLLGVSIIVLLIASTHLYRKKSNSLRELEVSASSSDADASSPSITKNL